MGDRCRSKLTEDEEADEEQNGDPNHDPCYPPHQDNPQKGEHHCQQYEAAFCMQVIFFLKVRIFTYANK